MDVTIEPETLCKCFHQLRHRSEYHGHSHPKRTSVVKNDFLAYEADVFFLKCADRRQSYIMPEHTWICDRCGQPIEKVEEGWIEWLVLQEGNSSVGKGLRLVHHFQSGSRAALQSCQYNQEQERERDGSHVNDSPLEEFLGPDGLMELLSLLDLNRLPKAEVLEMIKRLHVPGYEEARQYFDAALHEGVFEPNRPPGFYSQSDITAVLKFARKLEE